PRCPRSVPKVSPDILEVSPDVLRCPQGVPRCPQVSPGALKVSPDILKVSPGVLEVSPVSPDILEVSPGVSRCPQASPRCPQMSPRWPQLSPGVPRCPQGVPRCPQVSPSVPRLSPVSPEYVVQHWQEDAFFGEQFLSGVNPVLLRRCPRLPPNFPLTAPMVVPSLGPDTSLEKEMEAGRVFLADYALLEGLPTNVIEGRPQFVAAPLCLLWLNPSGQLLPVAIQLSQHPGPSSPIFLPGSQGWALAKLWVRGSHFILHEMVTHLLHGHFLAEAFAVATQRLPAAHPVHQLLLPHLRFTFHINILARETLLNPGGIIDQATSIGREGTLALVARGVAALTMAELCVPEDIRERGVGDIPGYHYRDDATAIWEAIDSYVQAIVSLFYPGDAAVAEDEELQDWVGEIFRYGVLGNQGSAGDTPGVPELVRFLTMIIFCCSARHAAVNSGQYDYAAWMPNTPGSLQRPPPAAPEEATEELLVATMPGPAATGALLALLSVVSYEGGEPDLLLSAPALRALGRFRSRLAAVSERIRARNARLGLPYPYLDPAGVQESISI
uniref:Lipoxygenase domain-containing protein n=1 Tax=Catharus ustulatus TaxID=91951 RepID=A0A8C3Y5Z3_CATUS